MKCVYCSKEVVEMRRVCKVKELFTIFIFLTQSERYAALISNHKRLFRCCLRPTARRLQCQRQNKRCECILGGYIYLAYHQENSSCLTSYLSHYIHMSYHISWFTTRESILSHSSGCTPCRALLQTCWQGESPESTYFSRSFGRGY